MATKSISELPSAASLDGTEAVPIVQGSTTVQTTSQAIASLTTKATLGLSNVNNTSDANKPISTATQTALNAKFATSGGSITGATTMSVTLKVAGNISGSATPVDTMTSGFVHIPIVLSGTTVPVTLPTPVLITGYAPMYLTKGSGNTFLYIHDGSSWKSVLLS
tara:strand:+ start:2910 stop:3401 length:492 start_codon:yes stop_codon:yes gene_type:complete